MVKQQMKDLFSFFSQQLNELLFLPKIFLRFFLYHVSTIENHTSRPSSTFVEKNANKVLATIFDYAVDSVRFGITDLLYHSNLRRRRRRRSRRILQKWYHQPLSGAKTPENVQSQQPASWCSGRHLKQATPTSHISPSEQ